MKVHELIKLLEEQKQDAEVRFSETFVSTVDPDERHSCGPEEGSQIFGVTAESANYDHSEVWEEHVVLQGEVLADVPGPHYPPSEDERGAQPLAKSVPDPAEISRDRRAVQVLREPTGKHDRAVPVSRAHKQKYKTFIQGLEDAKKKNAGLLLI